MAGPVVVDLTGEDNVAPSRQATVDRNKAKQPAVVVDLTGDEGYDNALTQSLGFVRDDVSSMEINRMFQDAARRATGEPSTSSFAGGTSDVVEQNGAGVTSDGAAYTQVADSPPMKKLRPCPRAGSGTSGSGISGSEQQPQLCSNCGSCGSCHRLRRCGCGLCRDCSNLGGWVAPLPAASESGPLSRAVGRLSCPGKGCGQQLSQDDLRELATDQSWATWLAKVLQAECWRLGLVQEPAGRSCCPGCGSEDGMVDIKRLAADASALQLKAACTARQLRGQGTKASLAAALSSILPGPGHSHAAAPAEISAYDCAIRVTPVLSPGSCSCAVSRICLSEGCTAAFCSAGSLFFSPGRGTGGGGGGGSGDPSAADGPLTLDLATSASMLLQADIVKLASSLRQETLHRQERKQNRRLSGVAAAGRQKQRQGKQWAAGTGFGGSEHSSVDDKGASQAARERAEAAQANRDRELEATLGRMSTCLKAVAGGRLRQRPVPLAAVAAVFQGGLTPSLELLLRNDCLTDVSERSGLYFALLKLLDQISAHPDLVSVLDRRPSGNETDGQPLVAVMGALRSQAEVFVKLQQSSVHEVEALSLGMALEIVTVCEKVESNCKAHRGLASSSAPLSGIRSGADSGSGTAPPPGPGPGPPPNEPRGTIQDRFLAALKPLQFQMRPLLQADSAAAPVGSGGTFDHKFAAAASASSQGSGGGGAGGHTYERNKRILKEVSSLASTLPLHWDSSIHIAVDENRFDVLRVLIFPDQATPYANGAFEFDVFLPSNYPNDPPKVHFRTTGGGAVRFNPNLYDCGKVCLSLLGTWQGPSWDPRCSTLLQVLISIQSLIFVPDPYFNEPGYERSMATPSGQQASAEYNRKIQRYTMEHAIVPLLRQPPRGPFKEVICAHFRFRAAEIIKRCDKWAADEIGAPSGDLSRHYKKPMPGKSPGPQKSKSLSAVAEEIRGLLRQKYNGA